MESQANDLNEQWQEFTQRKLDAREFRELSQRLGNFLKESAATSSKLKNNFNDVLMAQDFQDLTGQIIRKVITLVHDIENKLVELVRISGSKLPDKKHDSHKLEGPVVPGVDQGDVVSGQDDVDDLLSSLGF